MESLKNYPPDAVHIDQDCSDLSGRQVDHVFFNCTFRRLDGLTLERCDLNHSKFVTDTVEDALNFTITLGCLSFRNVEFSPLLFDLMLCLLIKSSGNTEKRRQLIEVMGRQRTAELLQILKGLE